MFGQPQKDAQLENLRKQFDGRILVEPLKTKINRHKIFWIGRSKHDQKQIRYGIEYANGNKFFYDWDSSKKDGGIGFEIMTPKEADQLEELIKEKRKK